MEDRRILCNLENEMKNEHTPATNAPSRNLPSPFPKRAIQAGVENAVRKAQNLGVTRIDPTLDFTLTQGVVGEPLYSPRKSAPGKFEKTEVPQVKQLLGSRKAPEEHGQAMGILMQRFGLKKMLDAIDTISADSLVQYEKFSCEIQARLMAVKCPEAQAQNMNAALAKEKTTNLERMPMEEMDELVKSDRKVRETVRKMHKNVVH